MSRHRSLRLLALKALLAVLRVAPAFATTPDRGPLERCLSIEGAEARLACYDSAAGRTPAAPAAVPGSRTETPVSTPPPASPPARAEAPPGPAPAARVATPAAAAGSDFGLTPAQRHLAPSGPDSEHAVIAAIADDGAGHLFVSLDSGQVWLVYEPDLRIGVGQTVTISRGALGSFTMVTAERHSYKVRRTR